MIFLMYSYIYIIWVLNPFSLLFLDDQGYASFRETIKPLFHSSEFCFVDFVYHFSSNAFLCYADILTSSCHCKSHSLQAGFSGDIQLDRVSTELPFFLIGCW
jgi:hypothetical protein